MKSTLVNSLLFLCAFAALANGQVGPNGGQPASEALSTIAALDLRRFMGAWFEIARYPNWFQKKCVSDTKANYSQLTDGTLQVINRCTTESGNLSEVVGAARQMGESTAPKLEVRFAPAWLSFLPAVWGDYWVIDLDPEYQLVAVSEPKRQYLWILSRTPKVSQKVYEELLARLEKKGFDIHNLEITRQQE
jgi:apolipoprotein D and lipocalin family protein